MQTKQSFFVQIRTLFVRPQGWLLLLLLFHLCANIWWLWADNHAIRTDEETHMMVARDYYDAFFPRVGDRSLQARLGAIARIRFDVGNPVHPPVLHIAGAVLVRLIGYSTGRLAFTNTLMFLVAMLGVYKLVRLIFDRGESVFATAVFSFTPLIYTSSRYFMTDFTSMAFVVWIMYSLLRSNFFRDTRWSVLFGILNGLAILTRTTAVLYYIVPCMILYGVGVCALFERDKGWRFNQMGLSRLILNAFLIVVIGVVLCGPWYVVHGEQFYRHWMKPDQGGAGAPIAIVRMEQPEPEQPARQPVPAQDARPEPAQAERKADTAADTDEVGITSPQPDAPGRWRLLLRRHIPWVRYPVFVINNGVFLPMFVMSLLGMLVCLLHKRFRGRFVPWFIIIWLLSSYYLLTIVLTFSTPRYAMQALPALSILSAFPILMLARGRGRSFLQLLYLGVLLFQYGNLTVHAYGPIADAKIPVYLDEEFQHVYDDHGLYFYKSILHASSAYGRMQAPMRDNYKDRLFFGMLKAEHERPFHGIEANYARLNIRGMIFDEQHYWLNNERPNPFQRSDIPSAIAPYRYFRHYGWGRTIEEVAPVLNVVDYVAYTTEDISDAKELEWLEILDDYGFELIDRFHEERFGQVHARYFGLLARKAPAPLPKVKSRGDIDALSMADAYRVRYSAAYPPLVSDLQEAVRERVAASFRSNAQPVAMTDDAVFLGAQVTHIRDNWYLLYLRFKCTKAMALNHRMVFQGIVPPEYMARHFNETSGKQGVFTWHRDPIPSTSLWPEQDYVMVKIPLHVLPIPYTIQFVFVCPANGIEGNTVRLGEIDFSSVPLRPENNVSGK